MVEVKKNVTLCLVVSLLTSLGIFKRSTATTPYPTTKRIILRDEVPKDFFESTIVRYTRETGNDSLLVHLIIEAAAAAAGPGNFGETIVKRYAKFGTPLMLLLHDGFANVTTSFGDYEAHREYETWSTFKHVVAVFDNIEAVKPENWKILYEKMWNARAHFAILINDSSFDRNSADRLLRGFWLTDCANVIIASLESSSTNAVRIYGYDPFAVDPNKRGSTEMTNNRGMVYEVGSRDPLFPEKLKNLRGQLVETSMYSHRPHASLTGETASLEGATGLDVEVARYAAKWLNFTISLRTGDADAVSYVVRLPGGRKVGPIGDVINGRSEYLANGQFLEVLNVYNRSLDFVYPYLRTRSVVVIRRAPSTQMTVVHWVQSDGDERRGHRMLLIIALAAALGLFTIIIYLRVLKKRTAGKTFLAIIGLVLFQHLPNIGRLASERIFCLVWIYCCFVICTVYQGYLVNDLTSLATLDNIDTLRDLVERVKPLRLMVRPYELRMLGRWAAATSHIGTRRKLADAAFVQINFSACLDKIRVSTNVACTIDRSYGEYALGQVRRYELMLKRDPGTPVIGNARAYLLPPLHIIGESFMEFWKTYLVRRGFPYLEIMNRAIANAVEFGLVDKWRKDDNETPFREPQASKQPHVLGLPNMDFTFNILIIGYVLATVAFIGEIVISRTRVLEYFKLRTRL